MNTQTNIQNLGGATQQNDKSTNNRPTGTREWAESNVNFITGCSNDCKYCYAKAMAIRHKRVKPDEWEREIIREGDLTKKIGKKDGMIMFPSSHDITPQHLPEALIMLRRLLSAGNDVLIVSKPHLECIRAICDELKDYKDQILLRFTIGSADSSVLRFWEPNAPDFAERLDSLKLAYTKGFATSVSCEPMLDDNIEAVVDAVSPFVTDSIWLGKMNRLRSQLKLNGHTDDVTAEKADELLAWQSDEKILALYERLQGNPLIRWKESIQKVLDKHQDSSIVKRQQCEPIVRTTTPEKPRRNRKPKVTLPSNRRYRGSNFHPKEIGIDCCGSGYNPSYDHHGFSGSGGGDPASDPG